MENDNFKIKRVDGDNKQSKEKYNSDFYQAADGANEDGKLRLKPVKLAESEHKFDQDNELEDATQPGNAGQINNLDSADFYHKENSNASRRVPPKPLTKEQLEYYKKAREESERRRALNQGKPNYYEIKQNQKAEQSGDKNRAPYHSVNYQNSSADYNKFASQYPNLQNYAENPYKEHTSYNYPQKQEAMYELPYKQANPKAKSKAELQAEELERQKQKLRYYESRYEDGENYNEAEEKYVISNDLKPKKRRGGF